MQQPQPIVRNKSTMNKNKSALRQAKKDESLDHNKYGTIFQMETMKNNGSVPNLRKEADHVRQFDGSTIDVYKKIQNPR